MAQPYVKSEYIKTEGDAAASPASFAESEAFEDAGDLEFRDDQRFNAVYLARVPKYVWEQWENLGDDEEIVLGTLRQSWIEKGDGSKGQETLSMLLKADVPQHQTIPKEYKLEIANPKVQNTFFFTEQDLPGFKSRSGKGFDPATANLPARLTRQKFDNKAAPGGEKQPFDPKKRFQPYYRRAIPKKTTLVGKVGVELNCTPVNNPETNRILAERTHLAMVPKASSVHLTGDKKAMVRGFMQPGTIAAQSAFGGFIKNTAATKAKSAQEHKTARIPQNELLDLLFQCFREYKFWSMKALRERLKQPEAYLRETLEKIADMPKSGRFAMRWTLKPENLVAQQGIQDEVLAPETEGQGDTDMDDDEEDFEDVNVN